jgi:DNA polymerase delta subunit 3
MLYDFHASQNSKQPNSVHATYLVTGTKKVETPLALPNGKDGDDVVMASSPFPSSWRDESHEEPRSSRIPVKTLTLVREEELEGVRLWLKQNT